MTAKDALEHQWIINQNHNKNNKSAFKEADSFIFKRLKDYKRPRLLKKEAMKIVLRILEDKHTGPLKSGFKRLDKNKSGVLDIETL